MTRQAVEVEIKFYKQFSNFLVGKQICRAAELTRQVRVSKIKLNSTSFFLIFEHVTCPVCRYASMQQHILSKHVFCQRDNSTLSRRSMFLINRSKSLDESPISPLKIIKVCFLSNSTNLGKNFKLVRCEEDWTVRVIFTFTLLSLSTSSTLYPKPNVHWLLTCFVIQNVPIQIQDIINAVLSSGCVGPGIKHTLCYSILLQHLKSSEKHWLHSELTVPELSQHYAQPHLEAEWRQELSLEHILGY